MNTSINRLVLVLYVLANVTMHVADSTVQIQVPEESYLNELTTLTCSTSQAFSNIIYKAPFGNSPQCTVTACTSVSGFQAVPINSSCTELTILRVQQGHAGQWGCADADQNFVYSRLVVAEKKPPCSITVDTCPVLLYGKISVTVTIQNYYCSVASNVSLLVGSVRQTLSTAAQVTGPTDIIAIKEINMTKEHFGDVRLVLICQKSRTISCGGVTVLHGRIPACQISSSRDTSSLRIGEDLLLNISTPRYYCSVAASLLLKMGKNDITLFNVTVNDTTKEYFVVKQRMTASHFGIVKLFFECGNYRQPLLCEGVQLLGTRYDSFGSDETGSTAAIVMGIVIIAMVVIIVLLLVKNLRNKNDGCKGRSLLQVEMCSIIRCLPWFKRNPNNQVPKPMETDDSQIQVHEKTMPAEDPILEVHEKAMPAKDPITEVHEKPMPAEEPTEEIHSKTSSSHESTI
ncbi:uncharacterized protein [Haliotis cracherodii]|uniref:uncharacterized protein n=1 Tax=Haliotis cracherodii TaxID=6455 RepID=UPI0039E9BE93